MKIGKVADILKAIMNFEREKLDNVDIDHGPTIGAMYEGLTSEILQKAIPPSLGLKVKSGFIKNSLNEKSPQIDCMLVRGDGKTVPYTQFREYHINDVLAIFEIKKTLYGEELKDAFQHQKKVLNLYDKEVQHNVSQEGVIRIEPALNVFAKITGSTPPVYEKLKELPFHLQMIHHTLISEMLAPLRIIFGYHGFTTEKGLRDSLINYLKDNVGEVTGFGVGSFPNFITSNGFSLLKTAGYPYCLKLDEQGYWNFIVSSSSNPIWIILELILTKINLLHKELYWNVGEYEEVFNQLLKGIAVKSSIASGWKYEYAEISADTLKKAGVKKSFQPYPLSWIEFLLMNELCQKGRIDTTDKELHSFIGSKKETPSQVFANLVKSGLVAWNETDLVLITTMCQCAMLPDGSYAAGENSHGQFTSYVFAKQRELKSNL